MQETGMNFGSPSSCLVQLLLYELYQRVVQGCRVPRAVASLPPLRLKLVPSIRFVLAQGPQAVANEIFRHGTPASWTSNNSKRDFTRRGKNLAAEALADSWRSHPLPFHTLPKSLVCEEFLSQEMGNRIETGTEISADGVCAKSPYRSFGEDKSSSFGPQGWRFHLAQPSV